MDSSTGLGVAGRRRSTGPGPAGGRGPLPCVLPTPCVGVGGPLRCAAPRGTGREGLAGRVRREPARAAVRWLGRGAPRAQARRLCCRRLGPSSRIISSSRSTARPSRGAGSSRRRAVYVRYWHPGASKPASLSPARLWIVPTARRQQQLVDALATLQPDWTFSVVTPTRPSRRLLVDTNSSGDAA